MHVCNHVMCFVCIYIVCVVCQYVCSVVCCTLAWKNGFAECQSLNNKSINEKIHTYFKDGPAVKNPIPLPSKVYNPL